MQYMVVHLFRVCTVSDDNLTTSFRDNGGNSMAKLFIFILAMCGPRPSIEAFGRWEG